MFRTGHAALDLNLLEPMQAYKPTADRIAFIMKPGNQTIRVTLDRIEELWNGTYFDNNKPMVMALSGFMTEVDQSEPAMHTTFFKAFSCHDEVNALVRMDLFK